MELRKPVYKNTEPLRKIYDDYDGISPLRHLRASFLNDEKTGDYRFDRVLARYGAADGDPNRGGNDDGDALLTRGRSLYMYVHDASVIGFGGQASYCQPLSKRHLLVQEFYLGKEKLEFSEITEKRVNAPSFWHGEYECGQFYLTVDKFFTEDNCAVLLYSIKNNGQLEEFMTSVT